MFLIVLQYDTFFKWGDIIMLLCVFPADLKVFNFA